MACEHHRTIAPETPRFWDDLEVALRGATRPRRRWPAVPWLRPARSLSGYLVHAALAVSLSSVVLAITPQLVRTASTATTTTVLATAEAVLPAVPTSLGEARALARARGHDVVVVRTLVEDRSDDGRVLAFTRGQAIHEEVGGARAPVVVVVGFAAAPALLY